MLLKNQNTENIQNKYSTYKVVSGDSLYSIAKKYNTTVNKIKDKNKKIIDINSVNICSDDKNIKLRVNSTIMAIDDSIKCIDE